MKINRFQSNPGGRRSLLQYSQAPTISVLAQDNINRSQKQLENVKAKYSLGMVAQIDVISAEYELSKPVRPFKCRK